MSSIDIKKMRDSFIQKQTVNEQNRLNGEKAVAAIKKVFASYDDEKIALLESRGIAIRSLLQYDLDRIVEDKHYRSDFLRLYSEVMRDFESFLDSESRDA